MEALSSDVVNLWFPSFPPISHPSHRYFETYGCQMNVNDTEIAWSLLMDAGYERTHELSEADVVMLMTYDVCLIHPNM